MKEKIRKKEIVAIVLMMSLMVVGYFYVSGSFKVNSTIWDVFSIEKGEVTAEGESWKLYVPKNEQNTSYLTCDKDVFAKPLIVGMVFYDSSDDNEIKSEKFNQYIEYDRRFFVGTKRWYLQRIWDEKKIAKAYLKILWPTSEIHTEYLSTNDLTEMELEQAEKWIEKHDKDYKYPRDYTYLNLVE